VSVYPERLSSTNNNLRSAAIAEKSDRTALSGIAVQHADC